MILARVRRPAGYRGTPGYTGIVQIDDDAQLQAVLDAAWRAFGDPGVVLRFPTPADFAARGRARLARIAGKPDRRAA